MRGSLPYTLSQMAAISRLTEPLRPLALLGGAAILSGVWLVTQSGQR